VKFLSWIVRWSLLAAMASAVGQVVFVAVGRPFPTGAAGALLWLHLPVLAGFLAQALLFRASRQPGWLASFLGRLTALLEFAETLEHELTHVFAGLLFLRPPGELHASTKEGGYVTLEKTNRVILLAPYLLPLWALLMAGLARILAPELRPVASAAALALYGLFLGRLRREAHRGQTDLQSTGLLFSFLLIPTWHLWGWSALCAHACGVSWGRLAEIWLEGVQWPVELVRLALSRMG